MGQKMGKVYNIGQATITADEILGSFRNFEWAIVNYNYGDYEGHGYAVVFDGKELFINNLDHCSCYGPLEGSFTSIGTVLELFQETDRSIFDEDLPPEIINKIKEILSDNTDS